MGYNRPYFHRGSESGSCTDLAGSTSEARSNHVLTLTFTDIPPGLCLRNICSHVLGYTKKINGRTQLNIIRGTIWNNGGNCRSLKISRLQKTYFEQFLWLAYLGYISSPMFKSFHTIHLGHLVFHIALPGIWSYSLKSRDLDDLGISRCEMSKHISGFVEEHILHCIYSNIASNPGCSKTKDNGFTSSKFNIEFMIQQKLTRTTRTLKSPGSVGGVCNFQSVNHFQVELQQKHLWHGTFQPGWLRFQDLIISTWNKPQWVFHAIPYRNLKKRFVPTARVYALRFCLLFLVQCWAVLGSYCFGQKILQRNQPRREVSTSNLRSLKRFFVTWSGRLPWMAGTHLHVSQIITKEVLFPKHHVLVSICFYVSFSGL